MKKFLRLMCILMLCLACLVGCTDTSGGGKSKDDDDEPKVVRYDLTDMNFANITVDLYEYNYIEFNYDEDTYLLKNKANDIVTKQTGEFEVDDDDNVTVTNDQNSEQNYLLYEGEELYFKGDSLYIEAYIPGYGDVYMVYTKDAKPENDETDDDKTNNDAVKVDIVRYDLSEIQFANVTVAHYEYNYVEFNFDDGTYVLENKVVANGIVSRQTGKFNVDSANNITVTNDQNSEQNYFLYLGEDLYFSGDYMYVEAYIPGYGDTYMIYEAE